LLRLLSCLACLALAACAAAPEWVNPELPAVRQGSDLTACRRLADREIAPGAATEPGAERSSDPMKMFDRIDTGRRFDSLVADCMTDRGYHRAP